MAMPIVRCPDPAALTARLAEVKRAQGEALLLFFGSEDPQTGESWCPDCVTADPVLRAAIAAGRPDLTLFESPVGLRSAWKNVPDHPYRLHPDLRVARIPTLIRFERGCEVGRLVEADCARPEAVAAFLRSG
jgi:hypothetical protein